MTVLQTFYISVLDSSIGELFRSLGITKEATGRFHLLWTSYLKENPNGSILDFIQSHDFDDKEKVMIGSLLLHNNVSNKITLFKE